MDLVSADYGIVAYHCIPPGLTMFGISRREPRFESQWLSWLFERHLSTMSLPCIRHEDWRHLRYYHERPEFRLAFCAVVKNAYAVQVTVCTDQGQWRAVYQVHYDPFWSAIWKTKGVSATKTRFHSLFAWRATHLCKFILGVLFYIMVGFATVSSITQLVTQILDSPYFRGEKPTQTSQTDRTNVFDL